MSPVQRWLFLGSTILTGITGVAYWWIKNLMEPMSEWAAINHPLQPWILKAHILVSPILVFAVGWIAGSHILRHIRESRHAGRRSGLLSVWVLAPMVFSGYMIQAVAHEAWLRVMVWIHLATGVLFIIGVATHRWSVRQRLRERSRTPSDTAAGGTGSDGTRGEPLPSHLVPGQES